MMTAITLIEEASNCEIHLFEKNNVLGKKVSISGGGRCNVTTGIRDKNVLLKNYFRGSDFLKPAMANFPPEKVFSWFEEKGIPLKVEADNRVFPQSDRGEDIVDLFSKLFKDRVEVHFNANVGNITKTEFENFLVESNNGSQNFDIVVISCGGNAYRHTGSTGDGYHFAKSCGHSITKLGPSLNSFEVKESWVKKLSGISLPDVKLKSKGTTSEGNFLFTHFGITGPCTFTLSAQTAFEQIDEKIPLEISFTPIKEMGYESWNEYLLEGANNHSKKKVKNYISAKLPTRLTEELIKLSNIDLEITLGALKKEMRKNLCHILSGECKLTALKRRKGDEFVTAGGVNLDEVNRKTMESKVTKNLYFAGEVLNIDGATGGFNLQSAWSTGRLAGINIAKVLNSTTKI